MRELASLGLVHWLTAYLVNAAWQVPVVFVAARLSARLLERVSAQAVHRVWVGALGAAVVLPACHLRLLRLFSVGASAAAGGSGDARVSMLSAVSARGSAVHFPVWGMVILLAVFAVALVVFGARLAWGLWRTESIRRQAGAVEMDAEFRAGWRRFCDAFEVREARIASSRAVSGPVVVGFRTPVLLVPEGFLESVTLEDWEAALAHEFAHVRRRDFAKNVLYGVMTLPVAWHPVVRVMLSRVAESREVVCDAMAAEVVQGRREYARSLLRLAGMLAGRPQPKTLHAIGIFDGNTLERRVMTLIEGQVEMKRARRLVSVAACVALTVAACGSALALRMNVDGAAAATGTVNPDLAKKDGNVTPVHIVYKKAPVYPQDAKKNPVDGVVVLEAIIMTDGTPENVHVVKSLREDYDQSAVNAVEQWRFTPAMKDGVPVEVDTHIQIHYSIK
ncbi:hypothetical protein GCM10011507_15310 [Edaphobacter acidisoli]|uniref:TonB C-terminal domain-containing protein n=1 Tax=Edaphobacter acidisoli TaxID=2040573 RepID=A0A916W4C0_9BACT|nr:M56 family metallopeptidase [Edaphobacter acidisoli]GGA64622.1 hypothetical protein GCM10011507_15310 [Edaphobacter acidisoli]